MLDIDVCADRTFIRLQARQDRFSGGMFEEPNEPGCTENGRHLVVGKVNDVLLVDDERQLARVADLGCLFHGICFVAIESSAGRKTPVFGGSFSYSPNLDYS